MEIWKDIKGYEGHYQVSNLGRVKSLQCTYRSAKRLVTKKCCIMTPRVSRDGYLAVHFGRGNNFFVHRLVANAFIPNDKNFKEINHKNENKKDNRVENLEWCDRKYNCNYGARNKRISVSHINNPLLSRRIVQKTIEGEYIKEYPSMMEVERQYGFRQGNISKCCRGLKKTAYGYKWSYV